MNELDKLYSPSQWARRPEVIKYHLEFIEKESAKTRNQIQCWLNVAYGESERQKIDIFGTDLANESAIFIFVHGGYWQTEELTRASYHFIANNLHKHNIKSINLGYDLCPKVTLSEIVQQFQNGVKKCLEYASENNSKGVYLMGHSAGAHLLSTLFTKLTSFPEPHKLLIKGAFLVSGVYDLVPVQKTIVNDLLKLDEAMAEELSPMKLKLQQLHWTSCYVFVGEVESSEFLRQSKEFAEKLKAHGFNTEFKVVPGVDHFNIIELLSNDVYEISQFVVEVINQT